MNPEHSCNCIFSMVNDSFLCNHYHFMKMSNSDRFKECFWHKRPKNHDFTPGFGAKMQFTQPKCTPNTHETISFYWLIIVLHAITIPSWKWMIYRVIQNLCTPQATKTTSPNFIPTVVGFNIFNLKLGRQKWSYGSK